MNNYEFADSMPAKSSKKTNQRHRRGRGYAASKSSRNTSSKSSNHASSSRSSSSLSAQSLGHHNQRAGQPKYQATNYYTSDGWDDNNTANPSRQSNKTPASDQDQNSCSGSLTYSASSSVQSGAESSNDSSFGDMLKVIEREGEGASELKAFMAKSSHAADSSLGIGGATDPAVEGWRQRAEGRTRQYHNAKQKKKKQQQLQQQYSMKSNPMPSSNTNVDLNYSRDDSSEDDNVFGLDFDENVLETIAGLDDNVVTNKNKLQHQSDPFIANVSTFNSAFAAAAAPTSPGRSHNTTPPPNSRHKRTSTPPGGAPAVLSRTNSRHSKSSSDGSWDTPVASSPPHGMAKPPHARSVPVSKTKRRSSHGESKKVEDALSEPFYAKSWMCGFADAFNFDS